MGFCSPAFTYTRPDTSCNFSTIWTFTDIIQDVSCNLFHNLEFHWHYTIFVWEYIFSSGYINTHTRGHFCQSMPEFNHTQISENYVFNVGLYGILFVILFGTVLKSHKKCYIKEIMNYCMRFYSVWIVVLDSS